MCFYECDWQVFRNAAPKPHLKRFPPGLKDHFWMWTTARCWITPRGGERARAADTIETKPADAHTSSHSTGALLLFDINYNVCFVLCPTLRTHTGVRRCMHMEIACLHTRILKHTLKYTHTHTSGSAAKPMKLSKPQFRGNRAIPQCAFPNPEWFNFPFGWLHIRHFLILFCQTGPFSSHIPTQTTCIPFYAQS